MGEAKQAEAAPRFRSRAEAAQLAAEFEASGLRRREFCAQHNLTVSTLDAYRKRRRQAEAAAGGQSRWVAVEVGEPRQGAGGGAESGLALTVAGRAADRDRARRSIIACCSAGSWE